uniref:Glycerol-3-phosphate-acyltransferase n=1 Tax=Mycena chlorophos TaxID=658473 RepID=A0ABQ0LAQ7_MYCCL|nr:glycerol-3-phosphate-acyltransferase [Mycena chlorophos]
MQLQIPHHVIRTTTGIAAKSFFTSIHTIGGEDCPKDIPIIVTATHHNMILDPVILSHTFPHRRILNYWRKATLFINPVVSWILYSSGNIPVDRKSNGGNFGWELASLEPLPPRGAFLDAIFSAGPRSSTRSAQRPTRSIAPRSVSCPSTNPRSLRRTSCSPSSTPSAPEPPANMFSKPEVSWVADWLPHEPPSSRLWCFNSTLLKFGARCVLLVISGPTTGREIGCSRSIKTAETRLSSGSGWGYSWRRRRGEVGAARAKSRGWLDAVLSLFSSTVNTTNNLLNDLKTSFSLGYQNSA